jgi:nucleoporin POM152
MRTIREQPLISDAGLYTIKSVSTEFCQGEVLEPTSCLLQNPPEPGLSLTSEDIVDRCAGNPIGLRVGLDLIGSPPFVVKYTEHNNRRKIPRELQIATLRSTVDFTPQDAGHYKYTFESIRDSVYKDTPLRNLELQQNVRPSAKASFIDNRRPKQVCIDDPVEFDVKLSGEAPWKLEYEVVHNGKRTKRTVETEEEYYTIKTDKLRSGGEYIVTLASISDKMGCKEFLKEEARVNVRHERPKAYFGHIEGKQAIMALEGRTIGLPLRFTGNAPWRLEYENLDTKEVKKETFQNPNAFLDVKTDGTYQLISVKDAVCPGLIEEKADQFLVQWVARPKLSVPESDAVVFEGGNYIKKPVCEGDEDALEVSLSGKSSSKFVTCSTFLICTQAMLHSMSLIKRSRTTQGASWYPSGTRIFTLQEALPQSERRHHKQAHMSTPSRSLPIRDMTTPTSTSLLSLSNRPFTRAQAHASTSQGRHTATALGNQRARRLFQSRSRALHLSIWRWRSSITVHPSRRSAYTRTFRPTSTT